MRQPSRAAVAERYPQHVTMRIVPGIPSLRQRRFLDLVHGCIAQSQRDAYRIVEFNIESNHLHLIIEAASSATRASGMKGLDVRLSRRINALLNRRGSLFAERYHARALKTPTEVRNALRYVLNNARHHDPNITLCLGEDWIDPYSSAAWFDGWERPVEANAEWNRELLALPAPTVKARSWLLKVGWRRHGLIRFDEMPGSRADRESATIPAVLLGPY